MDFLLKPFPPKKSGTNFVKHLHDSLSTFTMHANIRLLAYIVRVCNFFRAVVVFISSIPAGRRVLKAWCKTCIVFALCSVNRRIESTRAKVNRHVKVINTVFERYVKLPVLFTASLCSIPAYKADFYDVNCSEVVLTSKTKLAANPYQYLYSPIS